MKPTWEDAREWLGAEPYALVELRPDAEALKLGSSFVPLPDDVKAWPMLIIYPDRLTVFVEGQPRYVVGWDRETRIVVWRKLQTDTE